MIIYHGATDVGNVRTNNEDVFYICEACHYCLVADGMGGAAAGEVASQIFADTAKAVFGGHDGLSEGNTIARVQTTFKLANDKILKHVGRNPHDQGMGCTAELLAFSQKSFIIGHVGDSRTYRLKNRMLKQLTKDHSLVQEQLDKGLITQEEARRHPMRNVILRAVGVNDTVALDILKGKKNPGDVFLLCSDGLTDMVEEAAALAVLSTDGTLREKSESLIQLAKQAGGKDNVTVVLSAID
ncbi:MAG: Stp1/IreP family PP2C-type Ser/Thr phosphatase [Desulfosarcina sp.]|nr:Stp1/IreP family PP2C-type Ser/Thr phosphatase [Desulfosarcina sp.]MBC2741670.1 Stp1/IreP family PP2C-type Ser/Thr phosphatase [Desulfosarcina sp.]MBC2764584.1 Stp1/IreP family PP2C-type Ser/Thr phosphatase [Desulfosarcina sp.]